MNDDLLDEFENLWRRGGEAPSLELFAQRHSPAPDLMRELALIDLEHHWRRGADRAAPTERSAPSDLPPIAGWLDYCRRFPECDPRDVEARCHEYRVRQLFGDRPDYRPFASESPDIAELLATRLPDLAAQLTRATIHVLRYGQSAFACPLPGRIEVGRRRLDEPPSPGVVGSGDERRLLVAEAQAKTISRSQFRCTVIARDRVLIEHLAARSYVVCSPGGKLRDDASLILPIPSEIQLDGCAVRFDATS